ncbi:MAG TPA: glycosyltransferase family 25 protein [Rhizobiaceae bacterium]|nr:glycosyltransferase family 25 protein [Rhizobiaceae bacterium]
MKAVEAFVIHLGRATQRRPQVEKLLTQLHLPAGIIDAVDGNKLTREEIAAVFRRNLHRPGYPFEVRPTEIGCFLSHRKAWQTILDRKLDAGLIVEDDVTVDGALYPRLLAFALANLGGNDVIRFPYRDYTDKGRVVAREDGLTLAEPRIIGLGMQMQLVSKGAAGALLEATEIFDRPVDTTIQMPGVKGVRVLVARPTAIRQIGHLLGGTVVQKTRKSAGEVLSREIRRALYRSAVRFNALKKR